MKHKKWMFNFKDIMVLSCIICALIGLMTFVGYQYGSSGKYDNGYKNGYMLGSNQTELYYNATGVFPYQQWKDKHYLDKFQSPGEIIDSLEEDNG